MSVVSTIDWKVPLLSGIGIIITSLVLKLRKDFEAVGHLPGFRILFAPLSPFGAAIPTSWWNPGLLFIWLWRDTLYKKFNSEVFSVVSLFGGSPSIWTSNMDVARQILITGSKAKFAKAPEMGQSLLFWGPNVVASDHEEWRKYRRIISPAFNNDMYSLVWSESLRMYRDMIMSEGWASKTVVEVPVIQRLTFQFALTIIASCGFGLKFSWADPPRDDNSAMPLQEAFRIIANSPIFPLLAPKWLWKVPIPSIKRIRAAFDSARAFMQSQVKERREAIRQGAPGIATGTKSKKDIFSLMVESGEDDAKFYLDDHELIGNVFVMLFAGHETTAYTLAATLGFLSIYTEYQEEALQQILQVMGPDRDPTFEDYKNLDKVLACFYEAVRMLPAGAILIRKAQEDTALIIPKSLDDEETQALPLAKDTMVIVDLCGVQYNQRYFNNPEEYRPPRWYASNVKSKGDLQDSEEFTAFSIGSRACLGRKFATTEAVCFLAMLLRDWRVEPILQPGETLIQWRQRIMQATFLMTMGIRDIPLRFTRRVTA